MNNLLHQPLSIVHANIVRHSTTKQLDWPVNAVKTRFLSSEHMQKGYERRSSIPWENGFYTVPLGLVLLDRKDLAENSLHQQLLVQEQSYLLENREFG